MMNRRFAGPRRKQYTDGAVAVYVKDGGEVRLSALDLSGREDDLYIERQYPVCVSCGVGARINRSALVPATGRGKAASGG
jgi:hypothetical protein